MKSNKDKAIDSALNLSGCFSHPLWVWRWIPFFPVYWSMINNYERSYQEEMVAQRLPMRWLKVTLAAWGSWYMRFSLSSSVTVLIHPSPVFDKEKQLCSWGLSERKQKLMLFFPGRWVWNEVLQKTSSCYVTRFFRTNYLRWFSVRRTLTIYNAIPSLPCQCNCTHLIKVSVTQHLLLWPENQWTFHMTQDT